MLSRSLARWIGLLPVLLLVIGGAARGGYVEDKDGKTIIHVKVFGLPDPANPSTGNRAEVAGLRLFQERFPQIFAERYAARYKADPDTYGDHNWDNVDIELEKFSGIQVEGVETDLLAIAGGLAPDVLYINFRKSDDYIRNDFLYPLDEYYATMKESEKDFRINRKLWPVIERRGSDGEKHLWAMPYGGALGKVLLYRKDLFDAAGLEYPTTNWTWEQMYEACRVITNPVEGIYGLLLSRGKHESWYWCTFLWSAGGEAMHYYDEADEWRTVFDSRNAAVALDYYIAISAERWYDAKGDVRRGYSSKDSGETYTKWDRGEIGMIFSYVDEKLFSTINPEVTGMVPVPMGFPDEFGIRHRGGELNSRMMGMFAEVKDPIVRDAAWEFMRFYDCEEAVRVKTKVMVEGGLGRFVNPKYLRMFGYPEIERLAPPGWSTTFDVAIETGQPEPYGKNSNLAYQLMTFPIQDAEQMLRNDKLPADPQRRLNVLRELLTKQNAKANEQMIGLITPAERHSRTFKARWALLLIVITFALVFRRIFIAFTPPDANEGGSSSWNFRRYGWAYVLLIPAILTILTWSYIPLGRGSVMAFQDYRLLGQSRWVGLDNFGDLLVSGEWWAAVLNSVRYSTYVLGMTFLPPIILAIALQEVPRGSLVFRIIYYMPAVITGLVTALLWKQFYEPSERGTLNLLMLHIPAWGFLLSGLVLLGVCVMFARRLILHEMWLAAWCFFIAGLAMLTAAVSLASPIIIPVGAIDWQTVYEPSARVAGYTRLAGIAGSYLIGGGVYVVLLSFLLPQKIVFPKMKQVGGIILAVGVVLMVVWGVFGSVIELPSWESLWQLLVALPRRLTEFTPEPYNWLSNPKTAMIACVLPMVWAGMGPGCLIYLAALKGIPDDYYEAADIDGASFIDKILFVIFPTLKALVIINFVGAFIGSFYTATGNILVMTGGGANTEVAGLHIWYKAFTFLKFGPATAMAWMLGFLLIGFTVNQLRILSRVEFRTAGKTTE